MKSIAPPISNSHFGMKGIISIGLGIKSYTALKPLYSIVPSDTNLNQRDLPELVMMGGNLEPQYLSIKVE